MNRRPQYLDMPLPVHDEGATGSAHAQKGIWWLIVALTLLAFFLVSTGLTGGFR
jgi:hypothetical protein